MFDLDGTIINSEEGVTKCAQYALEYMGIVEEDMQKLRRFIGPPLIDSFNTLYGMNEEENLVAVAKFKERYAEKGIDECCLYEGIEELLRELKDRGFTLCLATSKGEHSAKKILRRFGILDCFDSVVGASPDGKFAKKGEIIQKLMRSYPSSEPREYIMIGDTAFDILGAKECGVKSVGVKYGFAQEGELQRAGSDFIAEDISDLKRILTGF